MDVEQYVFIYCGIGYDPNSEYKRWVRSLYRLGLILRIPSEWRAPETPEGKITCGPPASEKEEHLMTFPKFFPVRSTRRVSLLFRGL
jgi:hypothetical protein